MDEKEKRIIKSAREQFVRFGFKKTSLDDIIKIAQVGKGTVYKYFKNKDELFKRVTEVEYEAVYARLQSLIVSESDPEKKLVLYVRNKVQITRDYFTIRGKRDFVFEELKSAYNKISPDNSREVAILNEILKSGVRRDLFKTGNNQKRALILSLVINRFETKWCGMAAEKADEEINALFELVFEGIRR